MKPRCARARRRGRRRRVRGAGAGGGTWGPWRLLEESRRASCRELLHREVRRPSAVAASSWTGTIAGCSSRPWIRASRMNRAICFSLGASARMRLIATTRPIWRPRPRGPRPCRRARAGRRSGSAGAGPRSPRCRPRSCGPQVRSSASTGGSPHHRGPYARASPAARRATSDPVGTFGSATGIRRGQRPPRRLGRQPHRRPLGLEHRREHRRQGDRLLLRITTSLNRHTPSPAG